MTLVSNATTVAVGAAAPPVTVPTLTLNVATESGLGQQAGGIAWASAYVLNDGRIATYGIGFHGTTHDGSNAMRIIDPMPPYTANAPGSYQDFEWQQTTSPPRDTLGNAGFDTHISVYDNQPMAYSPSDNKAFWFSHGIFDFAPGVKTWFRGDVAPNTQPETAYIDFASSTTFSATYNPASAWCTALDMNAFYGKSGGSGGGYEFNLITLERNPAGGSAQPWKLVRTTLAGAQNIATGRNSACCIGTDFYFSGLIANISGVVTGGPVFYKVSLLTRTLTATLTPYNEASAGVFPQMIYDPVRARIILLGTRILEYNPANDAAGWVDVTPSNYPTAASNGGAMNHWRGVYHPTHNCIYLAFAGNYAATYQYKWHKLVFPQTGVTRFRTQTVNLAFDPFQGTAEMGFGSNKHVEIAWHPTKKRVYTDGGDAGYGAGAFGQANPGSNFTTNNPVSPRTYVRNANGLENDLYSIDPYGGANQPFRLEHPYMPRNLSGVREDKPPRGCQHSLNWDPVRNKFWRFQSHIRDDAGFHYMLADGVTPDVWAEGSLIVNPGNGTTYEATGTYSFVPGASGSPGTWTKETNNYLWGDGNYATPTVVGTSLRVTGGTSDHRYLGKYDYHAASDKYFSVFGANPGAIFMTIFDPVAKTYTWRKVTEPSCSYIACFNGKAVVIDDYIHTTATVSISGVRTSKILRVNLTTALAAANGATLPGSAAAFLQAPFSFSDNVWEGTGTDSNAQADVGMVGIDRKLVLIGSYTGIIFNGVTKISAYNPDTGLWTQGETAPANFSAHSWLALPDTGEVMMLPASLGAPTTTPASPIYYYRVR